MRSPPWPLAIVTGALGAGKTTLIRRLLVDDAAAGTLVIVNEFGEIGLDHLLLRAVTDDVVLLANGCLCCRVRQDLVRTLCDIRRDWLAGRIGPLARVVIETSGVAEPAPIIASLVTNPLVHEAFTLRTLTTVVDGEHGCGQIAASPSARAQIRLADRLLVSKTDLIDASSRLALLTELAALNPLVLVAETDRVGLHDLFARCFQTRRLSAFACDDHLDRLSCLVLRPCKDLDWPVFQGWLGSLITSHGDRVPRIKGCLAFAGFASPVIIQAVHHTFYPIETLPSRSGRGDQGLVVIHQIEQPDDIVASAASVGLVRSSR